jgi:hypothetical protein
MMRLMEKISIVPTMTGNGVVPVNGKPIYWGAYSLLEGTHRGYWPVDPDFYMFFEDHEHKKQIGPPITRGMYLWVYQNITHSNVQEKYQDNETVKFVIKMTQEEIDLVGIMAGLVK